MNLMNTIKNLHNVNEDRAIQKEIDEANVFQANLVKKALGIARKSSGNYDKAYAQIEKIKKGLADFPIVAKALKTANEGVEQNSDLDSLFEEALDEGNRDKIKQAYLQGPKKTGKDVANALKKIKKGTKLSIQHNKGIGRSGIGGGTVISVSGDKVKIKPTATNEPSVINAKDIIRMDTLKEEVELSEAPVKITSVRAKKGQYVFGKDEKKDISVVTYKGKVISTGDFDSGSDSWWMDIKGKKGQVSFDQPKDVVDYFTKNKITEDTTFDLDALFEEALSEGQRDDDKIASAILKSKKLKKTKDATQSY